MNQDIGQAAVAGAAAAGPVMVNLLGYDVPLLAAGISVLAVVLTSFIAPPPRRRLTAWQHTALVALLCVLMVALAITDPHRDLVMSTCWAVGLGYTGLPVIQAIRDRIFPQAIDSMAAPSPQTSETRDV